MLALLALLSILVLGTLVVVWAVTSYNRLVRHKNLFQRDWSLIDVQLKRRHDLVPNLVATVEGYATHERTTLEAVIQARAAAVAAPAGPEAAGAENVLTGALRQLLALSEAYPELKANTSFLALQTELSATEDHIADARTQYNSSVQAYQTAIDQFPGVIIARLTGFTDAAYWVADEADRELPAVEF